MYLCCLKDLGEKILDGTFDCELFLGLSGTEDQSHRLTVSMLWICVSPLNSSVIKAQL